MFFRVLLRPAVASAVFVRMYEYLGDPRAILGYSGLITGVEWRNNRGRGVVFAIFALP